MSNLSNTKYGNSKNVIKLTSENGFQIFSDFGILYLLCRAAKEVRYCFKPLKVDCADSGLLPSINTFEDSLDLIELTYKCSGTSTEINCR